MKDINKQDREIQSKLDKEINCISSDQQENDEERIYRLLYEGLKKSPENALPPQFANRVIERLKQKSGKQNEWALLLFFGLFAVIMVVASFLFFEIELSFTADILPKSLIKTCIFLVIVLALVQWADQKLLKSKLFKRMS